MSQSELLDYLETELNDLLKRVRNSFQDQPQEMLFWRPSPGQWNVQECFAHLNAEFDYYIPLIERTLHKAKARQWAPVEASYSNWYGRRAVRRVDPSNGTLRPKKSPKNMDPLKSLKVRDNELKVFLINVEMMLRLLRQARVVDLNRCKIKPMYWSLSSFLLSDLLQYLIRHTQRHLHQAQISFSR